MKILPSLSPFRSLGIEPSLLQTVTLSSMCLWRMQHGLRNESPPIPAEDYQAFGLADSQVVRSVLFEARHAMKEALIDTLLASNAFVEARAKQIALLHHDVTDHKDHLAQACREAIEQGLVPQRRMSQALAIAQKDPAQWDADESSSINVPTH